MSLDNLIDYVSFEQLGGHSIGVKIDRDGLGDAFEKTLIAEIYTNDVLTTLNELNQGVGVIL